MTSENFALDPSESRVLMNSARPGVPASVHALFDDLNSDAIRTCRNIGDLPLPEHLRDLHRTTTECRRLLEWNAPKSQSKAFGKIATMARNALSAAVEAHVLLYAAREIEQVTAEAVEIGVRDVGRVWLRSDRFEFEVTGEHRYPLWSTREAELSGKHADLYLRPGQRDKLVAAAVGEHAAWLRGRLMRATLKAIGLAFDMRRTLPSKANRRNSAAVWRVCGEVERFVAVRIDPVGAASLDGHRLGWPSLRHRRAEAEVAQLLAKTTTGDAPQSDGGEAGTEP